MLKCSTSLWSADLANLESEIKRVEPYSDRFHIDVADGHLVKTLLFFPDLVKALRQHTHLPFEVHLITIEPLRWVEPFIEAGADIIIFYLTAAEDPGGCYRSDQILRQRCRHFAPRPGFSRSARALLECLRHRHACRHGDRHQGRLDGCVDSGQDSPLSRNHHGAWAKNGNRSGWGNSPGDGAAHPCCRCRLHRARLLDVQRRSKGNARVACLLVNAEARKPTRL